MLRVTGIPVKKVRSRIRPWLGKGDQDFFFCIGYIGHADVPRLCLLRKTNKIARIIGAKF